MPQTERIKIKTIDIDTPLKTFLIIFPRVFYNKLLCTVLSIILMITIRIIKKSIIEIMVSNVLISSNFF